MKQRLFFVFVLSLATSCLAQFTTVAGTVTDPNGLPYANGTIIPILMLTGAGSPTLNGFAYSPPTQPTGLNATGSFTMRLGDNNVLLPAGTTWNFKVCSAAGTVQPAGGKGPVCFTLAAPITITGASQSITANLNAVALALTFGGGGGGTPGGADKQVQVNNAGSFGGIVNVAAGSVLASQGAAVFPVFQTKPLLDGRDFGMVCNNVTDDTAAFNAAILAAYNAVGGAVLVPNGTCLIAGQVTLPNDGGTVFNNSPLQPSIRITGAASSGALVPGGGSTPVPFGAGPAYGGSVLNLTNNSATAKIDTRGTGPLEIDHLTLADTSTDCATFLFTSNTTVSVHEVTFLGTKVGALACNDAIMLGNTSQVPSGNFNAPFQGYGTVIHDNYFQNVKRAVLGNSFANSVQVVDNTIWSSSGFTTGGAIEFGCIAACGQANANYIAGNLFEVTGYAYAIRIQNGLNNNIIGNSCWDPTPGTFVSCVTLGASSASNFVIGGISSPGANPYITTTGGSLTDSYIGGRFNDPNVFNNPISVALTATAGLTQGQIVKIDTSNALSVVVATTADTGPNIAMGVVANSPNAGATAYVARFGKIVNTASAAPLLGTGTCSLGQSVIVDTTTNGRVKCTSTPSPGTSIGTVIQAQAVVGNAVGLLLGADKGQGGLTIISDPTLPDLILGPTGATPPRSQVCYVTGAAQCSVLSNSGDTVVAANGGTGNLLLGTTNSSSGEIDFQTVCVGCGGEQFGWKITKERHFIPVVLGSFQPTIAAGCGTTPSVAGTDNSFKITVGTGGVATSCTVAFQTSFGARTPNCTANSETDIVALSVAPTATQVVVTASAAFTASSKIDVLCF